MRSNLFIHKHNWNYDENPTNPRIIWYTTSSTMSAIQKVVESNEPNKEPLGIASYIMCRSQIETKLNYNINEEQNTKNQPRNQHRN